jgi:hypothetical protein
MLQDRKIQDLSNSEIVINKEEKGLIEKRPLYVRTLNVFVAPFKRRYERLYRERKRHLVVDILFITVIVLLIILNIVLALKEYKVDLSWWPIRREEKVAGGELFLTVDKQTVAMGEQINYILTVKNNTNQNLEKLEVRAGLAGAAIEESSIKTKGSYAQNEIIWQSEQNEGLKSLKPGEEVQLDFSLKIKNKLMVTNPVVTVTAQMSGWMGNKIFSGQANEIAIKIKSDLGLETAYQYYTTEGEQLGIGPWPPQTGEQTSLRIFWRVKNNLNRVEEVKITGVLPPGVEWTGRTAVNVGENIEFDPEKREVSWKIKILTTTTEAEGNFEVNLTPQTEAKGLILIEKNGIKGYDTFAKEELIRTVPDLKIAW